MRELLCDDSAGYSSRRPTDRRQAGTLVSQRQLRDAGDDWHRAVLQGIGARLAGDPGFPCVFSKNAFQKELLKFIFVESMSESAVHTLGAGLAEYVELSRDWDGSLNTAYPLVVAFSLSVAHSLSAEGYDAFGWHLLQRLHAIDPAPWPESVGTDPNLDSWSMCFNGMPIFCNMSHPAHSARRSRNLGDHFLFIINPRERFDVVAGDTPSGRKVRANIRARIASYDGMPHCPQLASYGLGGVEWWQYSIADANIERTDMCPFRFLADEQ